MNNTVSKEFIQATKELVSNYSKEQILSALEKMRKEKDGE